MGCDIHAYLQEIEPKRAYAWGFGGEIHISRNYDLFGLLAGVRGGEAIFEPRGVPDVLCYQIEGDYYLTISDKRGTNEDGEHTCSSESADSWLEHKCSQHHPKDKNKITHPDWHTPSWLNTEEFERVLNEYVKQQLKESVSEESIKQRQEFKKHLETISKKGNKETKKRIAELTACEDSPEKMIHSIEHGIWQALAVLEVMKKAKKYGIEMQLVFWFDN
jgi:hypothetical protein